MAKRKAKLVVWPAVRGRDWYAQITPSGTSVSVVTIRGKTRAEAIRVACTAAGDLGYPETREAAL